MTLSKPTMKLVQTVWKLRHAERLEGCSPVLLSRTTLLKNVNSAPSITSLDHLPTSEEPLRNKGPPSTSQENGRENGGVLACGSEKHSSVSPCNSRHVSWRPPVPRPPRERALAALGLQQKAWLESLQPILTASAFDSTSTFKSFERILKVTFKACSNLSS